MKGKRSNTNDHEDRPAWMGKVGFADLKLKLIGAIVAISAVELLKAFLVSQNYTDSQLAWKVGIHFTFVLSGVFSPSLIILRKAASESKVLGGSCRDRDFCHRGA